MIPLRDVIPTRTTPWVTRAFILVNSLVFLLQVSMSPRDLDLFVREFGLVAIDFSWINVVTSMFLHGGWMHVLGNMLYLWIFGDNVEDRMGHGRFAAFYLLCGVAAALVAVRDQPRLDGADDRAPAAPSPASWARTSCSSPTRGS